MKTILKNKLTLIHTPKKSNLICINVSVIVGSNNETPKIMGISHFLEHMVFEGTATRTCEQLTAEIEKYGGDLNAYTSNDKTNFYVKIHKKHAEKAIEILSDILINPTFDEKTIKKEKNVVLGEINMVYDEPRNYQWVLFEKTLLPKPFSNPTYGTKKTVVELTRNDLINYHKKYYTANNTIISIVGECENYKSLVEKYFKFKNKNNKITSLKCTQSNKKKNYKEKKKNLSHKYLIIGYQTTKRLNKDSYTLDIIKAILAKGQSGRLFIEIRTKRGLTYDLGAYHHTAPLYGYFAFYANAEKKNIPKIQEIFFTEIKKLNNLTKKDLNEAKSFLEGQITLRIEDSQEHADLLSLFEECGDHKEFNNYIKNIKKVTLKDIKNVTKKYLNTKYTKIVIE